MLSQPRRVGTAGASCPWGATPGRPAAPASRVAWSAASLRLPACRTRFGALLALLARLSLSLPALALLSHRRKPVPTGGSGCAFAVERCWASRGALAQLGPPAPEGRPRVGRQRRPHEWLDVRLRCACLPVARGSGRCSLGSLACAHVRSMERSCSPQP